MPVLVLALLYFKRTTYRHPPEIRAASPSDPPSEYPRGAPRRGRDPSSTTARRPPSNAARMRRTVLVRRLAGLCQNAARRSRRAAPARAVRRPVEARRRVGAQGRADGIKARAALPRRPGRDAAALAELFNLGAGRSILRRATRALRVLATAPKSPVSEKSCFDRRRPTEYPRRGRGAAATPPPRNIHVVAAAPPRPRLHGRPPRNNVNLTGTSRASASSLRRLRRTSFRQASPTGPSTPRRSSSRCRTRREDPTSSARPRGTVTRNKTDRARASRYGTMARRYGRVSEETTPGTHTLRYAPDVADFEARVTIVEPGFSVALDSLPVPSMILVLHPGDQSGVAATPRRRFSRSRVPHGRSTLWPRRRCAPTGLWASMRALRPACGLIGYHTGAPGRRPVVVRAGARRRISEKEAPLRARAGKGALRHRGHVSPTRFCRGRRVGAAPLRPRVREPRRAREFWG